MAEYLKQNNIEKVLEDVVNEVLEKQPPNPFQAMAELFAKRAKTPVAMAAAAKPSTEAPATGVASADADAMETSVLSALEAGNIADSADFAAANGFDHMQLVDKCLKRMEAAEKIVREKKTTDGFKPTPDGEECLALGSPEFRVWSALSESLSKNELEAVLPPAVVKAGTSQGMKLKWFSVDKTTKKFAKIDPAATQSDSAQAVLKSLVSGGSLSAADSKDLTRRKLIVKTKLTTYCITKGAKYGSNEKFGSTLTAELLSSGGWQNLTFKPYNLKAAGKLEPGGFLHPLMKVRTQFREVFLELGFEEMPTDRFVESSFWNFDSLFQPQQHPARDAHDTFFIKGDAKSTLSMPMDYMATVKDTHQTGGNTGSIGYRMDWKETEAQKNLLRTHTTAISSRMLYRVAQEMKAKAVKDGCTEEEAFQPRRFFSVDRVFRNETMDATHLCEFHQVEGVVLDYDLTLGDLMGTIEQFFNKIGLTGCRFKPAYNPYTEPSMEIFSYHPGLKKWVEVGNSGMFRPEMMLPYGLPSGVRAIAWGLALERPTMILYGINNIRTLFGHDVSIDMIRTNPLCRLTV